MTGLLLLYKFDAHSGTVQWDGLPNYLPLQASPAPVAPAILPSGGTPLLVANAGQGVMAFDLQTGSNVGHLRLTGRSHGREVSNSPLQVYAGVVYFADTAGQLYGLDANLSPVAGLPSQIAASSILSGLRILPDAQGQAVVIFWATIPADATT